MRIINEGGVTINGFTILTDQLRADSLGSAESPTIAFPGDADNYDTGIYSDASGFIHITLNGSRRMSVTEDGVELNITTLFLGSEGSVDFGAGDGSWRTIRAGNDLVIERMESGIWVEKDRIEA